MRRTTLGPTVLVGRDAELATLRSRMREARIGHAQVVIIDGPAGIGKSALLTEFVANDAETAQVTWLRCDQFEQDISFSAAELLLGEPVEAACSELEVGRRLLARLGDSRRMKDVTLLVADDAHWMDGASVRALRFALRRLRVEPIIALVSRRPGSPGADQFATADPRGTTVLRPAPLDPSAVHELALRIRGWAVTGGTADHVVEQTGGSPLLISSVLHNAADQEQLERWRDIPATAAGAATRMLGSLDDESRLLVEASAVLAEPADLITLGGVADVPAAAPPVSAAAEAGLLTVDATGAVASTHALLREAVYDTIPLSRRQTLHARAADWTSGDRRLGHRAAAVSRPDPELVAQLVAAADLARSTRRYDLAATQRLRARRISADPTERDALLCEALIDRVSAQDLNGADELSEQAELLKPDPLRSLALGLLARERGQIGEARTYLQEALTSTSNSPYRRVHQRAAVAAAVLHVRLNEAALALAALDSVESYEDSELAGDAATTRGIGLWQIGDGSGALAHLGTVRLSPQGSAWEADLLAVRGMVHLYAGELAEAVVDLDRSIGMTHLWRPSTNQPRIYVMRCLVRYRRGDWDGALNDAAAARAFATHAEAWSVVWASAASIDVPANRGQWDIAAEHLAQARIALTKLSYPQVVDVVAHHESAIHTARGDHDPHLGLLEPLLAESHLEQLAAFRNYRWIFPAWISTCIHVGRLIDAEQGLDRYTAMLRRWPGGLDLDRLGWLRGLLAQARGEPDNARDHFQHDLADPKTSGDPFIHAQLRQAIGRSEHAAGRRREAIRHLSVAHELFSHLRATPFVERCRLDLTASGLRTSVTADTHVLTERQEDVAALVSRGYTNNEVARELLVTAKAVEYHLTGIYSKLGITSRRELRRLRTPSSAPWPKPSRTTERGNIS